MTNSVCTRLGRLGVAIVAVSMISSQAISSEKSAPSGSFDLIKGEQLYDGACSGCHGLKGDGNGVAGQYLDPKPRDFTIGLYKFRSTPSGELPTDQDMFNIIKVGIPGTQMPGFDNILSDEEIMQTVVYMKSFSATFTDNPQGTPIVIPPEPKVTPETIAEGKSLYMLLACWTCHGPSGKGDGTMAKLLRDTKGDPIRPFDFTKGVYRGGSENPQIYRTLMTGLDGTPMPSYAGALMFEGGTVTSKSQYEKMYTESEIQALEKYLAVQPTEFDINSMNEEAKKQLTNRRAWSLVHYCKSLTQKGGFFYNLFVKKTDVTN